MSVYTTLLSQQSEILENIKSINANFKKDGAKRKTLDYLQLRLERLEINWEKFDLNNTKILSLLGEKEKEGAYFENEIYNKVKELYISTKNLIMAFENKVQLEETPTSGEDSKIKLEMLNEQSSNIKAFKRSINSLNINEITEKWHLEDLLKTIQTRWEKVDTLYWKLDNIVSDSESEAYDTDYNYLENLYQKAKAEINTKIWSYTHQERSAPKIELPIFSGNWAQWTTFKDLFTESVHLNSFISKAQKMQHLKSKLKGEAERLVQHLNISAENYDACWSILQQRYDNIRLLFTYHANILLNQPSIQYPTSALIKKMHDTTIESLHAINNLHIDTINWDPLIVHILLQKLDADTTQHYVESLKNPREIPTLEDFLSFLENKFMALESTAKPRSSISEKHQQQKQPNFNYNALNRKPNLPQQKSLHMEKRSPKTFYNTIITCPHCNKQHGLYNCREFLNMTSEDRLKAVTKLNVCKNCLFSHNGNNCTSTKKCKICGKPHSSLLHDAYEQSPNKSGQRLSTHVAHDNQNEVLLTTAQIRVRSRDGTLITLRALLDQGSQVSLISENAAQRLKLKRHRLDAVISGIGALPSNKCKGVIQLKCLALHNDYTFETEALVMNALTNRLPNKTIDKNTFEHLKQIQLADPEFNVSQNIDLLLGADVYSEILMEGLLKNKGTSIIAQQTQLGWIVCGKYKTFNCHVIINNIADLAKFWEQEELNDDSAQIDPNDQCEQFYLQTTTRLSDGRYQVRLPLKQNFQNNLGESKPQAVAQFKQLERKMEKNAKFSNDYKDFMKEYEALGHMTESKNTTKLDNFLPHHGVIREESVTTKLRVVFNASAKTSTKHSLNDLMETGPNLQKDLLSILLQWRQYKYVLTADIEKMYRYIMIHPEDRSLQKIIWRDTPQQLLKEFELCTVTYGTKAAPYLALRTLQQLAIDEGRNYPEAKPILQNNFFVDDALFGKHTIQSAKSARNQLISLLSRGGFNLRKWQSNEPELVMDLPENMRNPQNFEFSDTKTSKTLGLEWNAKNDDFVFLHTKKTKQHKQTVLTKRTILSEISTLFDPLGWLSPLTIKLKILFQNLWKSKTSWDEEVSDEIKREWESIKNEMGYIEQLRINRWLGLSDTNIDCELHAFCDASEKAYSCVVYCTVRKNSEKPHTNLIAAKTKVAPINNKQTLPRLELCGALLLSRLVHKIKQCLNIQNIKVTAWTDSMVVLGWLHGDCNRWKTYVANRVREILLTIPADNWNHVKSEENPADCATRGLLPSQLVKFSLWWEGPEWLKSNKKSAVQNPENYATNIEAKVHAVTVQNSEPNITQQLLNKCSSMSKAVRTMAWVSRFITNARGQAGPQTYTTKHLTIQEIDKACKQFIITIQRENYEQEIKDLKSNGSVSTKSKILKLNPMLDKDDILRVHGRLQHSQLHGDAKNPIIIPSQTRLTQLLIDQAHHMTLHGGTRLTLATLRQKYWIIGGNRTVKDHLRHCVKCSRFRTSKEQQLMADLPKSRVTPSRPFTHTGVDFTGHVDIKINKGRGIKTCKGYIAIFICMSTKAVHLEIVSDLTSQTFLMALKRMAARRGTPLHMYSDNGTNFVGADKELKKQLKLAQTFNNSDFVNETNIMGIQWHFNAPVWPTAGGLWEAAVKSMKYHLRRVLGEQKLTYEEFLTLLTQIEACLNSRPLCPLTEDIDDLDILTPGHFLIGQPLISIPSEKLDCHINIRNRWQLTEKMHQDFWRKWSLEYLQQLQTRTKWNRRVNNVKNGDLVLIKEDNLPPAKWALGRVTEIHPGSDGLVRVVSLKTKDGWLKRPITRLIVLPIDHQSQNLHEQLQDEQKLNVRSTEINKQSNTHKQNKTIKRKKYSNMLCLLVTVMTLFTPSYQQANNFNILPFEQNKAIYFDEIGKLQSIHDNWKIISYYNMTTYWQGIDEIERLLRHVDDICKQFDYKVLCNSIVTELKQEVNEIQHNNFLLKGQHHRSQLHRVIRGVVDGVGYIANSLFGILDERFAEQYKKDIQMVHSQEYHLLKLIKKQTSIIEVQNNILKRNEEAMFKQFSLIQQHLNATDNYLNKLTEQIRSEESMNYFNLIAMASNIIINKLRHIQQMLLDTMTNIVHGQVDTRLLSQEQLLQELNTIAGQLPQHLSIPVDNIHEQLMNIYKLLHVKSRVVDNFFIIEIILPLTSDDQFALYKIIPIPMINANRTVSIRTSSELVAINLRKETYMSLEMKDIDKCVTVSDKNLVCILNKPTFNMRNTQVPCEINIITNTSTTQCTYIEKNCTNKWITLQAPNTWLYFCCKDCLLRIMCQEHMISRSAHLAGIISAGQGCIIKHGEATFYTHSTSYHSNIQVDLDVKVPMPYLQDINNITNQILPPPPPITTNIRSDMEKIEELHKRIKQLEEQGDDVPDELSSHDLHQYALSYSTLGTLVILVVAGCIYMHWKNRNCVNNNITSATTTATIAIPVQEAALEVGSPTIEMTSRPRTRAARSVYAIPHNNFNI